MPDPDAPIEIVICLGSSCFARGNAENLVEIQQYVRERDLEVPVYTRGQLCRERCTVGPSITIGGIEYTHVEAGTAVALLDRALKARNTT